MKNLDSRKGKTDSGESEKKGDHSHLYGEKKRKRITKASKKKKKSGLSYSIEHRS